MNIGASAVGSDVGPITKPRHKSVHYVSDVRNVRDVRDVRRFRFGLVMALCVQRLMWLNVSEGCWRKKNFVGGCRDEI